MKHLLDFAVVPVNQRLEALRCAVLLLPDEHREALQTFLAFLTDVAALASINQMTPSNLAVCLAPSLFHLPASGRSLNPSLNSPSGSAGSSPRRRKTVGVPDQRELSQNKAAHECLLQMILDFRTLFTVNASRSLPVGRVSLESCSPGPRRALPANQMYLPRRERARHTRRPEDGRVRRLAVVHQRLHGCPLEGGQRQVLALHYAIDT